jgi:hypothetical protein
MQTLGPFLVTFSVILLIQFRGLINSKAVEGRPLQKLQPPTPPNTPEPIRFCYDEGSNFGICVEEAQDCLPLAGQAQPDASGHCFAVSCLNDDEKLGLFRVICVVLVLHLEIRLVLVHSMRDSLV